MFMHALPGIVDGARKTSQVGGSVRNGAWGSSFRLSPLPMLETTSSRNQSGNQCIYAASVVRVVVQYSCTRDKGEKTGVETEPFVLKNTVV